MWPGRYARSWSISIQLLSRTPARLEWSRALRLSKRSTRRARIEGISSKEQVFSVVSIASTKLGSTMVTFLVRTEKITAIF